MKDLFKDLFIQTLKTYSRKATPVSPWDMNINDLIRVRSALDDIIGEMMNQTEQEKEARRQQVRKQQREYERQKEQRIKNTKIKYGLSNEVMEEMKEMEENKNSRKKNDYPRLNELYNNQLNKHEDKEESFFDFQIPVEGTKCDIGLFGGSIFIPDSCEELRRITYLYSEVF